MVKPMRTNSPIDDPVPFQPPEIKKVAKPPKPEPTEYEKLVKHRRFPEIAAYIAARKEFWRMYMPDGTRIQDVSKEVRDQWWACAAQIISEYEDFEQMLIDKVKLTKHDLSK